MSENIYPTKICTKCKQSKSLDDFGPHKKAKGGKQPRCRECNNKIIKEYRHTEEGKTKKRVWAKDYRHRAGYNLKQQKWAKTYFSTNINGYLASKCRTRLWNALDGNTKIGSAVADLGCTIDELRVHLESQFQHGMSWDNRGEWHIDHKKALANFDLTDREELLKAVHYTNLQPLRAVDNIRKSDN